MHCLVTGANGHVGSTLVKALVDRGYRVRATVRSLADPARTSMLRALGDVELRAADVRHTSQLREAMDGIDTLFHVAAVYDIVGRVPAQEILDSACLGTENALRAAKAAGVSHVVLTSSTVTLPQTAAGAPPVTESDWRTDLRETYARAKVESEQLAWRLSDELRIPLATILPAAVIGPGFARNTPTINIVLAAQMGMFRFGAPNGNYPFVDSRDLAEAHVRAAERRATGRFIVAYEDIPSFEALVRLLGRIDPRVKPPMMVLPTALAPFLPLYDALSHGLFGTPRIATPDAIAMAVSGLVWNYTTARARRELDWTPQVPLEHSLRDTLAILRARGATRT